MHMGQVDHCAAKIAFSETYILKCRIALGEAQFPANLSSDMILSLLGLPAKLLRANGDNDSMLNQRVIGRVL